MEVSVKQRLMQFLKYKKISQGKFEKACHLSNGYINNLKKSITVEKLQNILSAFPELNKDWILSGEGEMIITETEKLTPTEEIPQPVTECMDCRILQIKLEEKQATIDSLKQQLQQSQESNRQLMDLLKSTINNTDAEQPKKKVI